MAPGVVLGIVHRSLEDVLGRAELGGALATGSLCGAKLELSAAACSPQPVA
jgi:hypothetical protein